MSTDHYSEKYYLIMAFIFTILLLLISFGFGVLPSSGLLLIYGIIYIVYLFVLVFLGNINPISSLYSISVLLYFYQVPFINQVSLKTEGTYIINIQNNILAEYLFLYSLIIFLNFVVVLYLSRRFSSWEFYFQNDKFKFILRKMVLPSFVLSIFLLYFAISKIGGFNAYLSLNKFESVEDAKFLFFTWKEFAIIGMSTLVLSKSKNVIYYLIAIVLVFVEILTAKRLLMLCFIAFVYVSYVRKINFKILISIFLMMLLSNLVKYTYYNLKGFFSGENDASSIIWFQWSDFFRDSLLINEFNGHLKLTYLSLYYRLEHGYENLLQMLGSLLPLSSILDLNYMTAGEYLRIYLNEPWAGLASSMYLNPYLSTSVFGLFLIYIIYLLIVEFLYKLSKNFLVFKLIFISLIPFLFFYMQREELMIITRNIYVYFPVSALIMLSIIFVKGNKK